MKKILLVLLTVFILFPAFAQDYETIYADPQMAAEARRAQQPAVQAETQAAASQDSGSGFFVSGGVNTGLLVRHSDFGGNLGTIAGPDDSYPMTLHYASYNNYARAGVGYINVGGNWSVKDVGNFGAQVGMWAHGDINNMDNSIRMGDYFVYAKFFNDHFQFIGGQGGGSPISSGGWIGANWLSYTGLRFFLNDLTGISAGIKLPDPGQEGIKPVEYLTMLGAGIKFQYANWFVSLQFDNSPIYDDSETSYYGGLRRPADQQVIGIAGNVAFGTGIQNIYAGKGDLVFEALITNLGEDNIEGRGGLTAYTYSPIHAALALKTGLPIGEQFYIEIKGKYTMNQGDSAELDRAVFWGKAEVEPYISFKPFNHLTFDLAVYLALYVNSYYLALNARETVTQYSFDAGQVPRYEPLFDFLSPYQFAVKPKVNFNLTGVNVDFGYKGEFSRDHVNNTIFLDFRWSF